MLINGKEHKWQSLSYLPDSAHLPLRAKQHLNVQLAPPEAAPQCSMLNVRWKNLVLHELRLWTPVSSSTSHAV